MSDDTGYVRWPGDDGRYENTHEGGQYVFAFFVADSFRDPFFTCHEVERTVTLPRPDVIVDDSGHVYDHSGDRSWCRECGKDMNDDLASSPVLAAVCLGTSSGSWCLPGGGYFHCRREDLTGCGVALLEALELLYDRPARLVTYLDT